MLIEERAGRFRFDATGDEQHDRGLGSVLYGAGGSTRDEPVRSSAHRPLSPIDRSYFLTRVPRGARKRSLSDGRNCAVFLPVRLGPSLRSTACHRMPPRRFCVILAANSVTRPIAGLTSSNARSYPRDNAGSTDQVLFWTHVACQVTGALKAVQGRQRRSAARAHASSLFIPTTRLWAALKSRLLLNQAGFWSRNLSEVSSKHRITDLYAWTLG